MATTKMAVPFNREQAVLNIFNKLKLRPQEGYVLLQKVIPGASQSYIFDVTNNVTTHGPELATENRIRQNDAFLPTKIGLAIRKAAANTPLALSQAVQRYFPNPNVFATALEAPALEAIYNSTIVINASSVNVSEQQWTQVFRYVGQTIQGVQAGSGVGAGGLQPMDEKAGPSVGMIPFQQDIIFNGTANQTITINMAAPNDPTVGGTITGVDVVEIFFWGAYVVNGGKYVEDASVDVFVKTQGGTKKK